MKWLRILAVVNALVLALGFSAPAVLGATPERDLAPVRAAVRKSLACLADEGRDWMESRSCVTCHHAPMMIRSLNHAKLRGFEVDEKALADVLAWTLALKAKLITPPPAQGRRRKTGRTMFSPWPTILPWLPSSRRLARLGGGAHEAGAASA